MSVSILEFWKLAIASGLLTPARCQQLHATFAGLKGASQQANLGSLTQWLVAERVLTRYQVAQLTAGRAGPFLFGDYTIVKRLESGRFAGFFRATASPDRHALLVFGAHLSDDPQDADDLVQRAIAASQVASPHVSRVLQVVDTDPLTIAVEELSGHTLREHLASGKRPSLTTACRIGFQTALGLVALHATERVHGSVWPENLWVDGSGTIKVLQFPFVRGASMVTQRQLPAADYLAPELGDAKQLPSVLTDIYALGCTLYELIAGRVVFEGGTPDEKIGRHRTEVPERLDRRVSGVPEELADMVAEMLDKEPMLRCQSANQVAHLLSRFVTSSKGRGVSPPRINDSGPAVGFGAWHAPSWQAPPQLPSGTPVAPPATEKPARPAAEVAAPSPVKAMAAAPTDRDDQRSRAQWPLSDRNAEAPAGTTIAPPIVITDAPLGAGTAVARKRKSPGIWIGLGALALLGITATIVTLVTSGGAPQVDAARPRVAGQEAAADPVASNQTGEPTPQAAAAPPSPSDAGVDDDGNSLWLSPTAGEPLSVDYLPSGTQAIVVLRPAELLAGEEGSKLADALGPGGETAMTMLRGILGVPLDQVDQLSIAFYSDEAGNMQAAFVMRLGNAIPGEKLLAEWGQPAEVTHLSKKFWQAAERDYWFPDAADSRVVAIAPHAALREIIERDGPPLLRGGIERLLRHSDRARQFTLLWAPSYLNTDGKSLLVGELNQLREPLARFFHESIEAVLLSGHLGEQAGEVKFFLELRAVAPPEKKPNELTVQLRQQVGNLPQRIAVHVASLAPQPYSQQVVQRFPKMVLLLDQYTRSGIDDRQAVLNAYLPGAAAHNLLLAMQLVLSAHPGSAPAGAASQAASSTPSGASAALDRKISLSFPRESLDRCMEQFASELGVAIEIVGADLQLEGITKNQSINNLNLRDLPARQVLDQVLKLANPEGKLVYVIGSDGEKGEVIRITTRAAAAKRGDQLPAEFIEKSSPASP